MLTPRRRSQERGVAALEFIGIVPFVILMGLMAFQLGVAGWATSVAGAAARVGARAATLENPAVGRSEAMAAIPLALRTGAKADATCDGDSCTVTVTIPIPRVIQPIPVGSVQRSQDMPRIP